MELLLIPLLIATIVAVTYGRYIHQPSWEYLRNREPNRKPWIEMFPSELMPVVEDALDDIRKAFLLREDDVFRLRPDDLLLDIYRSAYPRGGADTLEFNNLDNFLQKKGIPEDFRSELTNPTVLDIINLCLTHSVNSDAMVNHDR